MIMRVFTAREHKISLLNIVNLRQTIQICTFSKNVCAHNQKFCCCLFSKVVDMGFACDVIVTQSPFGKGFDMAIPVQVRLNTYIISQQHSIFILKKYFMT